MPEFFVTVKDKATGKESKMRVGGDIRTQTDAEAHVKGMATSVGGEHPGFEVVTDAAPKGKEGKSA